MDRSPPQLVVPPDTYEVVGEDFLLVAEVRSTLAVCIYDAVEEPGALLHLQFVARGDQRLDVTDRTLASDLLLLDRALADLRKLAPRAQNLQGKLVADASSVNPRSTADAVIDIVTDCLRDAGVRIVSSDLDGGSRRVRFRPQMGQLHVDPLKTR